MAFYSSHKVKMFDFLSYEVFQIVVITALFVIAIMLFMLYKRPSENISQYLDNIDYRIEKMNKKLDELTNTFVNGLIVDEEDSDASSINMESNEEHQQMQERQEVKKDGSLNEVQSKEVKSLNYEGIEFSDIPNFSTDTSVLDEDVTKIQEAPEQLEQLQELQKLQELQEVQEVQEPEELQELQELQEPEEAHELGEINEKKRVNIIKRIIQSEE